MLNRIAAHRNLPRDAWRATAFLLCLMGQVRAQSGATTSQPTSSPASTPTSRPVPKFVTMAHEAMLAEVSKRPLVTVTQKSSAGKDLTDAEKSELRAADESMKKSVSARKQGDFRGASLSSREALDVYQKIFGAAHYLSVTALVETTTTSQFATGAPAEREDLATADRSEEAAEAAAKQGNFFLARTEARKAVDIRERILGKNHSELGDSLRILGNAQIELQSFDDAQALLLRALELVEATYGKNHPKTALILDRLGWLRIYQGKYELAANHLRRAVYIFNSSTGETAETAESLDNLGTALTYPGEYEEAINGKLRALFIRQTLLGPEAKDTGVSLSNLAWLYSRIGKRDEIIPLRRKALAIFEKVLGIDHHDTIIELSNLAQALFVEGKNDEAAKLFEQQIARDDKHTGPIDPGSVNRLMVLGSIYLKSDRLPDAERTLSRALEKGIQLYESGERTAAVNELLRISKAFEIHRMLDDALKVREKLWQWDEAQVTLANASTIQRKAQLARLYIDVGRAKDAKEVLLKAVGEAKLLYGQGEPETIAPLLSLCTAQEKLGEYDEAVKVCGEVLRLIEARLNKDSPSAVFAMALLGRIQTRQKNYDIAKFSLEEAQEKFDKSARKDRLVEIGIRRNLAVCQLGLGQKEDALKLFRKVIDQAREEAKNGGAYAEAELAESIKKLLDVAGELSLDAKERDELRSELRNVLEKLRQAKALDADNKAWLQELSSPGAKG